MNFLFNFEQILYKSFVEINKVKKKSETTDILPAAKFLYILSFFSQNVRFQEENFPQFKTAISVLKKYIYMSNSAILKRKSM